MTVTQTATEPVRWNPFDPAMRSDPYPIYERLLAEDPVHHNELGMVVLSRFADCETVLRSPLSSSDETRSPMFAEFAADAADPAALARLLELRPFLFLDPPDHTRLRGLVSKAFTPRTIERLRTRVQSLVDVLLDDIAERGSCDVVADFAYPLPVTVISEMLGVPAEDSEHFIGWSRALARGLDPEFVLPAEVIEERNTAIAEFHEYFRRLIAQRRGDPRDDVLSALVHAEEEGKRLSENELLSTCTLLLVAGHETTVNLIANGVLALLRHPQQFDRLRSEPELVKHAVEEVLRYDPPVQMTGRLLLGDLDITGATLTAETFVITLVGAANRDPAVTDLPSQFDITRREIRHLAFGLGHHFCLGAPLARMEGQVALGSFAARFAAAELDGSDLCYRENLVLRGLSSLPVRVGAEASHSSSS